MLENDNEQHPYTKGNRDDIVKRVDMVHSMTIYCPINDKGVELFRLNLIKRLKQYMKTEYMFNLIPVFDVFTCFTETLEYCKNNNIFKENLYSFWGVVQSFKHVKFISLEFVDDKDILCSYEYIRGSSKNKSSENIQRIYKIDSIELVWSDMFTQDIIDMFNKILMFYEIIPNSYLEREFLISFYYDDYMSYMEMIVNNNGIELSRMDKNIIDYLLLFPKIISINKPIIRILTNYGDI